MTYEGSSERRRRKKEKDRVFSSVGDTDVGDNAELKNLKELAICAAGLGARQATFQDANTHSLVLAGSLVSDVKKLLDLGVVSAGDMTIEACVTKIAYVRAPSQPRAQPVLAPVHIARSDRAAFCAQLLGRNVSGERLRKMMVADLRGELTVRQSSTWRELVQGMRARVAGANRTRTRTVSVRSAAMFIFTD